MADVQLGDALRTISTIEVTTGAAPVDVTLPDPAITQSLIVLVTSGGTGEEILNIPSYGDGMGNPSNPYPVGVTITVVLDTQTDPADVIVIQDEATPNFKVYCGGLSDYVYPDGNAVVTLTQELQAAGFVWAYDRWEFNNDATDGNNVRAATVGDFTVQGYPGSPDVPTGGKLTVKGGDGAAVGEGMGGDGGPLDLVPGIGGGGDSSGANGIIRIKPLYTTAPDSALLDNGHVTMWVDEMLNTLNFKLKYSDGTVKSGSVALT
jgi:hypothetical protein